jgi:hypothetical protein
VQGRLEGHPRRETLSGLDESNLFSAVQKSLILLNDSHVNFLRFVWYGFIHSICWGCRSGYCEGSAPWPSIRRDGTRTASRRMPSWDCSAQALHQLPVIASRITFSFFGGALLFGVSGNGDELTLS